MADNGRGRDEDTFDPETPLDLAERLASDETRSRLDATLNALAHRRRRDALYCLAERDPETVSGLARELAARQTGVSVDEMSSEGVDRIETDLYHVHLPKLSEAGIVEYDDRSGAISYSWPPETVETLLDVCRTIELDD
ncbi:DUF7344 domain-containing protein [Halorussus marinus]|uniref:DUF7344 domain-containing protein n=1 Tax=Halorussus marinus TaxID=2505976 RepID=UPI001091C8F2|nr:helix-turn-helix transcriptional regulator [Halorussus marinus]